MKKLFIVIAVLSLSAGSVLAQDFLDDFEDGNIDEWTVVEHGGYYGNAEISTDQYHSSDHSMWMWNGGATVVQRNDFNASFGTYEAWFYVDGSSADGWMFFQVTDNNNEYRVECRPNGGDGPELRLEKVIDGVQTTLGLVTPPPFSMGEWFKLTIYRGADGAIDVYVDDVSQISVNDTEYMEPAGFCVASWENAYVDDVSFNGPAIIPTLSEWGLILLSLLLLAGGTAAIVRMRRIKVVER
jgi:hypothetical protein